MIVPLSGVRPARWMHEARDDPCNRVEENDDSCHYNGNQPWLGDQERHERGKAMAGVCTEAAGYLHDRTQSELGGKKPCDRIPAQKTQNDSEYLQRMKKCFFDRLFH
jgi:hypothetical protein